MGNDLYMVAEIHESARWRLHPTDIEVWAYRDLSAVLCGWKDPPELMKPVAAFLPLRGLPGDLSPELEQEGLRDDLADPQSCIFGVNWLLARELLDFPWHERRVTHIFHPDKSRPLGYLVPHAPDGTYTESYAEFVSDFVERVLPKIRSLGEPDAVRVVYWVC